MSLITIRPFQTEDTQQIIELILNIQVNEFGVPVTIKDQPDLEMIASFYQKDHGNFWVAVKQDRIVGTIALVDIGNSQVGLRKMFVAKEYRGKELGIAQDLLQAVLDWCKEKNVKQIYLGTVAILFAAHRFYEKNGFKEIAKADLPVNFAPMLVDTKFYVRQVD